MKLTKLSLALAGCAALASGVAQAAGPTLSDVLGNSGISESGYIDAAYTYLDAGSTTVDAFDGGNGNTFNLKQAAIQLAKQPASGFGGLVNITMGSDADIIKSSPYSAGAGKSGGFDLTQAFAQYTTGALTVQGGKFATLASAEVIAPTGNTNITRSIEFFQVPYTHTGLRSTYAASSTLTLYAGLNNGWDEQQDVNHGKTLELGMAFAPSANFTWALQAYSGPEVVTELGGSVDHGSSRQLVDTVLTWKATSALTLILNADYGKQAKASQVTDGSDATWNALAGYANYQWSDKWRTSLRIESFDDKDGYKLDMADSSGVLNKKVSEGTFTVGYAPDASFELRGEVRDDKADKKVFAKYNSSGMTDSAMTVAIEGLYKF